MDAWARLLEERRRLKRRLGLDNVGGSAGGGGGTGGLSASEPIGFERGRAPGAGAEEREWPPRVGTGVPELDEALGGGLRPGEVVELAGASGTGKTTTCCAAAIAALRASKDSSSVVHWLSSGSGLALARGAAEAGVDASRVVVHFVRRARDLLEALDSIARDPRAVELLILDSVAPIVTPLLQRGPAGSSSANNWRRSPRGPGLVRLLGSLLHRAASTHSAPFLVTNQCVGRGSETRPALGRLWRLVPDRAWWLEREPRPLSEASRSPLRVRRVR